jgi:hypothetical protein
VISGAAFSWFVLFGRLKRMNEKLEASVKFSYEKSTFEMK